MRALARLLPRAVPVAALAAVLAAGLLLVPLAAAPAIAEEAASATDGPAAMRGGTGDGEARRDRAEKGRPGHHRRERPDHDQARAALQAGEILPLPAILDRVRHEFLGDVIEVELERRHELWLYQVRLLVPDGQVLRLFYDARTTELVAARGRNLIQAIRPGRPPFQPPPPAPHAPEAVPGDAERDE